MLRSLFLLLVLMLSVDMASAEPQRHGSTIRAIDLAGVRDIGGHHQGAMSVSPDGMYVAFQLQAPILDEGDYELTWYVAETKPGGDVWPVGDGGELILNPRMRWITNGNRPPVAPLWSPDGKWIVYLKRSQDNTEIWRSRRDGSVQEQITKNKGNVLSVIASLDNSVLFAVAGDPEIVEQQLKNEGDRGFLHDNRFVLGMKVSPFIRTCKSTDAGGNKKVLLLRACEPQLRVYEFDKKMEREATEEDVAAYHSSTRNTPQELGGHDVRQFFKAKGGSKQAWLQNENPKRYPGPAAPVRLFASVSGSIFRCDAKICEAYNEIIEGVWFRPESNEIVFQRADGSNKSMTGLYAWTPGSADVRTILQTEDKLADCEVFDTHAICLREQWTHPRTIISLDLSNGDIRTIYDPNPHFDEFRFSRIEKIEWIGEFGCAAHGHLVYPLNYEEWRRYPLVITTYRSRGFLRGATGDEYPIHVLAANGFMVLSYDMPRCFERHALIEDTYIADWDDLHERRSSLSTQKRILEILHDRGLIDLRRTAITGFSDGADQVRFALIHTDRFTTAIASSAFDYRAFYYLSNKDWRAHWEVRFAGPPDKDKKGYWGALSLGQNVDRVAEPLLINVSANEALFSIENVSRLLEAGRAIEMYIFPGEYHVKWQPQHRLAIYRRNIQWLKFWLMGREVDDPIDPDQYTRWQTMRDDRCAQKDLNTPSYCRTEKPQIGS